MAGRSKELIIRGGYNITPLEIETALHLHPAVQQAAVVGVPHEVLGEDIAAAVTLRPGQRTEPDEIIAFCREHLADNKVPRTLLIIDAMPLNPNGKILKKELEIEEHTSELQSLMRISYAVFCLKKKNTNMTAHI